MDEAGNCVVHDCCWEVYLKKTAEEPLNRGILEVGRLWTHFARHQRRKKADPDNTDGYSPPNDLSFDAYFADIQEACLPDDGSVEGHLFAKKTEEEVQQLLWSTGLAEVLRGRRFAERQSRRMTERELFLRPEASESPDPYQEVPPACRAADFLKAMHLFDPDLETSLYTELEGPRVEPLGRALGRQSQESDDEGVEPSTYCSGCGSDGCWMGADRCRRQRKAERLRALVDLLVERCTDRVTEEFAKYAEDPLHDAKLGSYTLEEANQRIVEFKLNANRQLALMSLQRSKRAVEIKRLRLRAGVLEVPGEGLPIWQFGDVRKHAVDQLRLIEDWTGERIASEDTDDNRIVNECALRPLLKLGPESLVRQCEYGKAHLGNPRRSLNTFF